MEKLTQALCSVFDENEFIKIIFAGKRKKSLPYKKITLRPVMMKGQYAYQAEYHFDQKVTHKNIPEYEGMRFAIETIEKDFKQINILTESEDIQILAANPDHPRITRQTASRKTASLSHNKKKQYILSDGTPYDFLIKLGVMSSEGKVIQKQYSKFRQINRFLEIADHCLEHLPENETLRIIDFGCGKSYLTFALYYYLKCLKGRDLEVIGLDLKEDVIQFCNRIAKELNYEHLTFLTGDIADYESDGAHMVVTLHACDTATDFALINAVKWHSRVILSVPCCQHELFSQIQNQINAPMLKHGIIKDKFTELLTDGLRGLKLESVGYHVNMMEFTSLEHTSKNIMIKAVLPETINSDAVQKAAEEYEALKKFYNVNPTIDLLK